MNIEFRIEPSDAEWQVWIEDHACIGVGPTKPEAVSDALREIADLSIQLIGIAIELRKVSASAEALTPTPAGADAPASQSKETK